MDRIIADPQSFGFETIIRIPKEKLIYIICDFYWNKNYRTIYIMKDPKDYGNFIHYYPSLNIEGTSEIKQISVTTYKKDENKQVFDSVNVIFKEEWLDKTQMEWYADFGFKNWQILYAIVAFFIGLYHAGKTEISGSMAGLILIALLVPILFLAFLRAKKFEGHPSIENFRAEFENHIREKENELYYERY
ncbi:hypothetical protein HWN40_05195 [Methanolobus zinderi]|uniref:Uncharacterized protein n=1 Tax=Methanolobus zinderi TaxID=536044 RepID=A0A7D5I3V5_9EURY|nr:hypothetical protein [Methanolobus zinderi]QLC49688.1 hypothetical protein HWN40_05195 [Methanolobus zinderi]